MKELLGSEVVVSVPARADLVHVLRTVTASVAARLDFPYDAIADLRLAVDEACAQLLAVEAESSTLTLRMTPTEEGLELLTTLDADVDWPPTDAEESLPWRLMSALADVVTFEQGDGGPAIHLTKALSSIDRDRG
ncbi:MAG TPA: ATP-binding protein [Actinomycetota bacterium]|nr:ATP-binding protein [Actinomycetota bacterium]